MNRLGDLQTGLFLPEEMARERNLAVGREEALAQILERHPELDTPAYHEAYRCQFESGSNKRMDNNPPVIRNPILQRSLEYLGRVIPSRARMPVAAALLLAACSPTTIPTNTPSPTIPSPPTTSTPSAGQMFENELSSLRISHPFIANEIDAIVAEVKTDNPETKEVDESVVTLEERGAVLAVVKDPSFLTVAQHDGLTGGWKLKNYTSGYAELRDRTYSPWLLVELPNLTLALNGKVLVEDLYNDEPDIREMNGSYIFALHREGKMILPPSLDDETLKGLYSDEVKRRAMLMNLFFNQDWNFSRELAKRVGATSSPAAGYEAKKANLEALPKVYEAITRAYNNSSFNVVCTYLRECMSEHDWASRSWNGWLLDRSNNNWPNTVAAFREIDRIISSDPEVGEKWRILRFIHGYAMNSHFSQWSINLATMTNDGDTWDEGPMISMLPVTYKAFGVPITHAMSAPSDGLNVTEFVIGGVPQYLLDEINRKTGQYGIVDLDYGIGLYSLRLPMQQDGAKRLVYASPITRHLFANGLSNGVVWRAE